MKGRAKPRRLSELAIGRNNHFNLLRFLAAVAVLVSHAWPLALGRGTVEPLKAALGYSLGELAVYVFFGLSGFFIAGSYNRQGAALSFVTARAARLLPGLAVSILIVALIMGPLVSRLDAGTYLSHPDTARFIVQNILLFKPQYTLPGVFTTNPYPTVEGSIWTLAHEVACYALILFVGLVGALSRRRVIAVLLALYLIAWGIAPYLGDLIHPRLQQTRLLSLPFVFGASCWIWRDYITLRWPFVFGLIVLTWAVHATVFAFPMLALAVTYTSLWAGYCKLGPLLMFNRVGDYSYGIYIYAMPLQGLVVWVWGDMTPALNIALALPLTLLSAVLSWHWIERPALTFVREGFLRGSLITRRIAPRR